MRESVFATKLGGGFSKPDKFAEIVYHSLQ